MKHACFHVDYYPAVCKVIGCVHRYNYMSLTGLETHHVRP